MREVTEEQRTDIFASQCKLVYLASPFGYEGDWQMDGEDRRRAAKLCENATDIAFGLNARGISVISPLTYIVGAMNRKRQNSLDWDTWMKLGFAQSQEM